MDSDTLVPPHPPPPLRLAEEHAWTIAMTWQEPLQGLVRLVVDRDRPVDSIIASFTWIRIDTENPSLQRAVMLTWSALASCPGFSGAENPSFWKRVFSELLVDRRERVPHEGCRIGKRDEIVPVTDTTGFFDQPGHAFPRFMVTIPYPMDDQYYRVFTQDGPVLDSEISVQLGAVLARLQLYQEETRLEPMDLCLRIDLFLSDGHDVPLPSFVRAVNAMPTSLFRIRRIQFRDSFHLTNNATIAAFLAFAQTTPVSLGHFHFTPLLDSITRDARAQWLGAFLRLDGFGVQLDVQSFDFPRHYVDDAGFQALFSALPFARSVHTLQFSTECTERSGGFEQLDLPWIAYALFHPQAQYSSWRHLHLESVTITARSRFVLTAMARGNNLLALLNGTTPNSDAYFSAKLKAASTVFAKPASTSRVVFTSTSETVVDVCGITSVDPATWDAWVAVIIPAYGLGYVPKHTLHAVQAHSPSAPSSFGLHLIHKYNYNNDIRDDSPDVLLHVLEPLGAMVTYLNIDSYTDISASMLERILAACSSLKVLIASHAGDFWCHPLLNGRVLPLEELELSVYYRHPRVVAPARDVLTTTLRHLRALRFRVYDMQIDQLSASVSTLRDVLRYLPSLQYLHWRDFHANTTWKERRPVPFTVSAAWTLKALGQRGHADPNSLCGYVAWSEACAIAFLSVVGHKRDTPSALGQLNNRDVVTTIFAFATSRTLRMVYIEPSSKRAEAQPKQQSPPVPTRKRDRRSCLIQ